MLIATCHKLLKSVGVDRAIGFTVVGKAWLSIAGVVSLVFVGRCLSPDQQGYYYTFGSLLALQVFVELGLTNVIMQFASHERAHLEWTSQGTLEGVIRAKSRLASLLRFTFRWYSTAAMLFVVVLLPAGFVFFTRYTSNQAPVAWQLPWVWTVLAAAGILLAMPVLAFLEGCGLVAEVARFRLIQAIVANVALWIALLDGAGLASAGIFVTVNLITTVLWLLMCHRTLLANLLHFTIDDKIDWRGEVWPYQWRIAISWLCGYLIFQLFTPLLFAYHGPVEAGRMGMAIALTGAVASLGTSWLTTKAPQFGVLIAHGRFDDLDRIFFRSFKQAAGVAALAASFIVALVAALHVSGHPLAGRVLDLTPLSLLVLSTIVNVLVTAEAIYLRAFKREPFLPISVLNAIFVASSACFLVRFYGTTEMMLGYLTVNLVVGLGLGTWIFRRKRRSWRKELAPCV